MIYNPYAKKRPRPEPGTNENVSAVVAAPPRPPPNQPQQQQHCIGSRGIQNLTNLASGSQSQQKPQQQQRHPFAEDSPKPTTISKNHPKPPLQSRPHQQQGLSNSFQNITPQGSTSAIKPSGNAHVVHQNQTRPPAPKMDSSHSNDVPDTKRSRLLSNPQHHGSEPPNRCNGSINSFVPEVLSEPRTSTDIAPIDLFSYPDPSFRNVQNQGTLIPSTTSTQAQIPPPQLSQPTIRNPYASRSSGLKSSHQVVKVPIISNTATSCSFKATLIGGSQNQSQIEASTNTAVPKVSTIRQSCSSEGPPPRSMTTNSNRPLNTENPYRKNGFVPPSKIHGSFHKTITTLPQYPAEQGQYRNTHNGNGDINHSVSSNTPMGPSSSVTTGESSTVAVSGGRQPPALSSLTCPKARISSSVSPRLPPSSSVASIPPLPPELQPQPLQHPHNSRGPAAIMTHSAPRNTYSKVAPSPSTTPNQTRPSKLTSKPSTTSTNHHKPSTVNPYQQQAVPGAESFAVEKNHCGLVPTPTFSKPQVLTASSCHPGIESSSNRHQDNSTISNPYRKKSAPAVNCFAYKNQSATMLPAVAVSQQASASTSTLSSRPTQPPSLVSQKDEPKSQAIPVTTHRQTPRLTGPSPCAEQIPKHPSKVATAHSMASMRPTSWTAHSAKGGLPKASSSAATVPPIETQAQQKTVNPRVELPGEDALPQEIQFSHEDLKPVCDEYRQQLVSNAAVSRPLLNGWTLFNHQKQAILQGIQMRRMILALDMGMGKTLIGCVWGKAFQKTFDCLKIFVISPVTLKEEWKRTAEKATGLRVQDDSSPKDSEIQSLDMKICSWAKVPRDVDPSVGRYVVICDEAHSMQSMQAARTKEVLRLMSDKRCIGVLLLTGTPMKNGKPCNLFPLLRAVGHPLGKHQKGFEKHFCAGVEKSFGRGRPVWDANGSSNLKQLKRLVSSHLLHLTKDQCLKSLPPLTREVRVVPVSSRCQLQHNQAVQDLAKIHAASVNVKDNGEAILGAVQRLRFVCSVAKVTATVEVAKKILETEAAIVMFTNFVQVAKQLYQQLADAGWKGELLTGETPAKKRQAMVDRFQEGLSPVFICTFGAGGVGLTLTAAHTVILLDRPWTPGDTRQAEDRVRRIGQTKPVTSIWMSAFEMDKHVDEMLESKTQTSDAVLVKGRTSAGGLSSSIISKLLANFAPGQR